MPLYVVDPVILGNGSNNGNCEVTCDELFARMSADDRRNLVEGPVAKQNRRVEWVLDKFEHEGELIAFDVIMEVIHMSTAELIKLESK